MLRKRGLVAFVVLAYACLMLAGIQTAFAAGVPALLITELVPNAKNVPNPATPGKNFDEAYEMAEIYNNSGKNVSLKEFHLVVTEDGKPDIVFTWEDGYADKVIPAGGVLVVWFRSDTNPFTVSDFYQHYAAKNPDLKMDQIALAHNGFLTNSTPHSIIVVKEDGTKVCSASYTGNNETKDDRGIKYAYPLDGSIEMRMVGFGSDSLVTPGALEAGQVPAK